MKALVVGPDRYDPRGVASFCNAVFPVPLLPRLLCSLMFRRYSSIIEPEYNIGKDSFFTHGGIGAVLHPRCSVGDRILIGQGVTLAGSFGERTPAVENDIWIGPRARLPGDITLGQNTVIGTNAAITKDVPRNSLVDEVPAKVIRTNNDGSLDVAIGRLRDGNWLGNKQ